MAKQQINSQQISPTARQSGWGFVNITTSGTEQGVAVTFPTPFASVPKCVIVTPHGWTTGTPTNLASFTGHYGASFGLSIHAVNITATGFTVAFRGNQAFGVSKSAFSWIAEA